VREVASSGASEGATFAACLATILELPLEELPDIPPGEDVAGWRVSRWLGGLGLGLVKVSDPPSFSWAGPWIGRVLPFGAVDHRAVVMYGVPSGVAWDPSGVTDVTGHATFPSGLPGSALTLIEREVCDSFTPPLGPGEHRRNVVTGGIDLNGLVGREFAMGDVRCRGMRLCEPCTVIERYASRPVLRPLVHRGGLRADILDDGVIRVGDPVRVR
jgi:hypothetical protein